MKKLILILWVIVFSFALEPALLAQAVELGDGKTSDSKTDLDGKHAAPPLAPTPCFDGWYVGVHGGGLLGAGNGQSISLETIVTNPGRSFIDSASGRRDNDDWAGQGGVHVGRNFQHGGWVFGAELDFSGSTYESDSGSVFASISAPRDIAALATAHTDLEWYSTFRPRIGHTLGQRVFLFATGGVAFGAPNYELNADLDVNLREGTTPFSLTVSNPNDDLQVGWTVGGGLEMCLTQHFFLTFTYLYVDLGRNDSSLSYSETSPNGNFTVNAFAEAETDVRFHVFQLGLSYKF